MPEHAPPQQGVTDKGTAARFVRAADSAIVAVAALGTGALSWNEKTFIAAKLVREWGTFVQSVHTHLENFFFCFDNQMFLSIIDGVRNNSIAETACPCGPAASWRRMTSQNERRNFFYFFMDMEWRCARTYRRLQKQNWRRELRSIKVKNKNSAFILRRFCV